VKGKRKMNPRMQATLHGNAAPMPGIPDRLWGRVRPYSVSARKRGSFEMRFHKMHGCGNDFVLVDCFLEDVDDPSATAVQVCDRHIGVGADGLLLVVPPSDLGSEHAAGMRIFNPDGSEAEMCGNGIRCIAAYLCDVGRCASSDRVLIETAAGTRRVVVKTRAMAARVSSGLRWAFPSFWTWPAAAMGRRIEQGKGK